MEAFILPLVGGSLIGIAVSMMLIFNGRVTGISGIANGLLSYSKGDMPWRVAFVSGLVAGGVILYQIYPQAFASELHADLWQVIAAGFVVGFGTIMGSGCTSGHGVCGISRMSVRSILATLTFIAVGILTASFLRGAL